MQEFNLSSARKRSRSREAETPRSFKARALDPELFARDPRKQTPAAAAKTTRATSPRLATAQRAESARKRKSPDTGFKSFQARRARRRPVA